MFAHISENTTENNKIARARIFIGTDVGNQPIFLETNRITSGAFSLRDIGIDLRTAVESIIGGSLSTPYGTFYLPTDDGITLDCSFEPFHPDGLAEQIKISTLTALGANSSLILNRTEIEWELRSSPTPFFSLQELSDALKLGALHPSRSMFEVVVMNHVAVERDSIISGTEAQIGLRLEGSLQQSKSRLGYRLLQQDAATERSSISGDCLDWELAENGAQIGRTTLSVPPGSVLQLIASYDDVAQSYWWINDPNTSQNPRYAAYNSFDEGLTILRDFVSYPRSKGNARDLEVAVSWLFWLLGFSVSHFGNTPRTQDAADLIISTPQGHFAVVECTTGTLKTDNKLPLLLARSKKVEKSLRNSNHNFPRILPIIVTALPRAEIVADLDQAERLGVYVLAAEDIEEGILRANTANNADILFSDAEKSVLSALEKLKIGESI